MKLVNTFHLTLFIIIVSAVFILSCAGFKQAYEERVCWDGNSLVPLQCDKAFINFRCPEDLTSLSGQSITTNKKIVIKPVVGYSAPKVGELFSQVGSIPIFVKSGSPWVTLYGDVAQILRQLGYEVRSNPDGSESVIEADIKFLYVRSEPGGFFDLKGTTHATASFRVVLHQSVGGEKWSNEFTGKHQIKVMYAFLGDAEETLGQAYCRALENFAHAAQSEGFYNMVR